MYLLVNYFSLMNNLSFLIDVKYVWFDMYSLGTQKRSTPYVPHLSEHL